MISFDRRFSASVLLQAASGRLILSLILTALSLGLLPAQASAGLILQVECHGPGGRHRFVRCRSFRHVRVIRRLRLLGRVVGRSRLGHHLHGCE